MSLDQLDSVTEAVDARLPQAAPWLAVATEWGGPMAEGQTRREKQGGKTVVFE